MDAHAARHDNLGCGIALVIGATALIALAFFVPDSQLRQTTGVITERTTRARPGLGGLSDIKYDYTVDGTLYHGERYVRYYAPLDSFLAVGSSILVWYDRAQPTVSYPVNRPWRLPLIVGAVAPLASGITIIFFVLRR